MSIGSGQSYALQEFRQRVKAEDWVTQIREWNSTCLENPWQNALTAEPQTMCGRIGGSGLVGGCLDRIASHTFENRWRASSVPIRTWT